MILGGYQRLTLIDYPGHIATTVFTAGCSFRCPFCHNPELVLGTGRDLSVQAKNEKEFFAFLKKRQGKLDGVCITGGEPTIQPDIVEFIQKIKKMGFAVKLDSNGTRPDVIKKLLDLKLLDYIAMDIKSSQEKYAQTVGFGSDTQKFTPLLDRVKLSVELIMHSRVPYEFRTTVVPGLHAKKDFLEIAKWIGGAREYWLQEYRDNFKLLDPTIREKTRGKKINLENIKKMIEKDFGKVGIRR